jgi:hypothetical protein
MVRENVVNPLIGVVSGLKSGRIYEKQILKKVRPLFDKSGKNSAPDFPGPIKFFSALFVLCGRTFGPLATLNGRPCANDRVSDSGSMPSRGSQFLDFQFHTVCN